MGFFNQQNIGEILRLGLRQPEFNQIGYFN
jgi:hypothetical protein